MTKEAFKNWLQPYNENKTETINNWV
jgi:hypothetical protein